jgi:hypothetical protein
MPDAKPRWQIVAEVLEQCPEQDRLPLLAYFEQENRRLGDLATLRALKEYREHLLMKPQSKD